MIPMESIYAWYYLCGDRLRDSRVLIHGLPDQQNPLKPIEN